MRVTVCGHDFDVDLDYVDASEATVREQLRAYEAGERDRFDLDVSYPEGFLGEVMAAMCSIPPGETRTYGEVAASVDSAAVAVGSVCGKNPVPVVVPCHRVVAADGLGGYSALGGRDAKRALLEREGATV
ncbi:methylated-DNA--[protein]-cysteine S-methyltransferase [Halobacterium sp. R2-5]|uniref:methylated-DNA--[protein]-cysteine S-methyltransferase n=1 Tax=Halobacterium sp. R2-5 TaxID=2715751 RepID=UPI0014213103|nr:methylated-DNA--[protein]-cysteine S-methyltransferase [Halobacterium sp. R2-5]